MEEFASFVSTVTSSVVVSSFVRWKLLEEFYSAKFKKARAEQEKKAAAQSVSSSSGTVPKYVAQAASRRDVADSETSGEKRVNVAKPSSSSAPEAQPTFPIGTMYDEVKNTLTLSTSEVIDFMNVHNIVINAIEAAAKQLTSKEKAKENAKETQPSANSAPVAPAVPTAPEAAPAVQLQVASAAPEMPPVAPEQADLAKYFVEKIQSPDAHNTATVDGFNIHLHNSPSSARRAIAKRKAAEKAEQKMKKKKKTMQAVRKQAPTRSSAIKFKHARDTPPKVRVRGHTFAQREVLALEERIKGGRFKRTLIREFYDSERAKEDGMFKNRHFRSYQQMVYRMKRDMGYK